MQSEQPSPVRRAKLLPEQVREIRAAHRAGTIPIRELALMYGVTPSAISTIVHGRSWAHVLGEPAATPDDEPAPTGDHCSEAV